MTRESLVKWLPRALEDVALWDQRGCLSPVAWVVETGGSLSPEEFTEAYSEGMAALGEEWPRGRMDMESEAALMACWDDYRVRAALSEDVLCWPHAVLDRTGFSPQGLVGRHVRVLPVSPGVEGAEVLQEWMGLLSTVVVVGDGATHERVKEWSSRLGASRICAPGDAQSPTASWRHDGRDVLRSLFA
jgi:hypothetical protein